MTVTLTPAARRDLYWLAQPGQRWRVTLRRPAWEQLHAAGFLAGSQDYPVVTSAGRAYVLGLVTPPSPPA